MWPAAAGAAEDVLHARADVGGFARAPPVRLPCTGDVVADGRPARVEIDAPVETDHVAARRALSRAEATPCPCRNE